jgi:hypothetical protein
LVKIIWKSAVPIFSHSWTIPQAFRKLLFRCSIGDLKTDSTWSY